MQFQMSVDCDLSQKSPIFFDRGEFLTDFNITGLISLRIQYRYDIENDCFAPSAATTAFQSTLHTSSHFSDVASQSDAPFLLPNDTSISQKLTYLLRGAISQQQHICSHPLNITYRPVFPNG